MNSVQAHELKPQEYEFETLNMQVGVRLQLITHRRLKPVQHFSTLIGYVRDDYLILKLPFEDGAPIGLTEGERVTVRVFSGVNVCSFACTVQRVFGRPLFYVHLSFPTSIQGTSLRGAMRVRADLPVRVTGLKDGAVPMDCLLANVSVTGARIDSPQPLPQDEDVVELQFALAAPPSLQETRVRTRATIRNLAVARPAAGQTEMYSYGVQFTNLDPVHYTLLQNMTYEALLADRGKIV
ncbi:flagellar brake protein [Massilia sp.]|uniref:flagellar brake protein n=1 Tax=Massilia sp. TaxID=1882437 RepID=UPI00289E3950|nr:flagellar brake protein [Massilia sp.]